MIGQIDHLKRKLYIDTANHYQYMGRKGMPPMPHDLTKTLSFLALHLVVGFSVAYAFTGSIALAGGIALVEPLVNAVVFFFHERAWRGEFSLAKLFSHGHGPTAAA